MIWVVIAFNAVLTGAAFLRAPREKAKRGERHVRSVVKSERRRARKPTEEAMTRKAFHSPSEAERHCRETGRTFAKWYSVGTFGGQRRKTKATRYGRIPEFPYHILFCTNPRPLKDAPKRLPRRIRKHHP